MAEQGIVRVYGVQMDKPYKENRVGVDQGEPFGSAAFTTMGSIGTTGHFVLVPTKEKVT